MKCPLLLPFLIMAGGFASAQSVLIAPYKDGKSAAFSFTLDDGYKDSVVESRQVFQETGVRATYFLMPVSMEGGKGGLLSWDDARALLKEGHEIGGHAVISTKLHETDEATLDKTVNGGWQIFRDKLGYEAYSFALPGGSKRTPEVEAKIYEKYGVIRGGKLAQGWGSARKGVEWPVSKTESQVARVLDSGGWGSAIIHGITTGYRPFSSMEHFKEHVEAVTSKKEQIWIAPMGEVARYLKSAEETKITTVVKQGEMEISFSAENPNAAALTLVLSPDGKTMEDVTASQAGKPLQVIREKDRFLIEVMPGEDPVRVSWK